MLYYIYFVLPTLVFHIIGFLAYICVLHYIFKKKVTEKLIGLYILAWMIYIPFHVGLWMFPIDQIIGFIPYLIGFAVAFLIFDGACFHYLKVRGW